MNEDQPPDEDRNEQEFGEEDDAEEQSTASSRIAVADETEQPPYNYRTQYANTRRNPFASLVDWWKGLLPGHSYPTQKPEKENLATVTLHYDEQAQCSVAVLSRPCPNGVCSVYFTCRVEQGTARRHSPLYYELDGFVREQFHQVQRAVHPHTVHMAVGALETSDAAHVAYLQAQRRRKHWARHARRGGGGDDDISREETLMRGKQQSVAPRLDTDRLALALDICRLHRLPDDLDILSLYCLAQVNRSCRALASRILRCQRRQWDVRVTPYVDGANASGFSRMTRRDETNLVQHMESGRSVLYRQCQQVALRKSNCSSSHDDCDRYLPVDSTQSFSWACEEIALAHLHQWWGDIAERDYIGQKMVLQWHQPAADGPVVLDTLRLEAGTLPGTRVWQSHKTAVALHVLHSETRAIDNVTLSYAGEARLVAVRVPWMTLVQAAAKLEWPRLTQEYVSLQQVRPLLPHELEYGELIHDLANIKE